MKTRLIALTFLLCSPMANAAVLKGTVSDVTGAVVQNAYVFIFDDQAKISPKTVFAGKSTVSERSGVFELEIVPGFYDVCVFSSGFTTACQKMHITKDRGLVVHDVKLEVDPLILRERGDSFPPR